MHKFLVLNTHVEGHPLNMNGQLLSGVRPFNFGLNLYLHSFYVCASSEGPCDAASKRRHVLEMTDHIFNKYRKSHELAHFFPKQPFSYEIQW